VREIAVSHSLAKLLPDEAATLIENGLLAALSGFTAAGRPTAVLRALAARAVAEHAGGRALWVRLLTGAASGVADDVLAAAD